MSPLDHLERLRERLPAARAAELSRSFVDDVLAAADDPPTLDYVRLNIVATAR